MGFSRSEMNSWNNSRRNGWSLPLHPFQFIAWIVSVYQAVFFYCTTAPQFIVNIQYAAYTTVTVVLVIYVVAHLLAVSINPADDNVLLKYESQGNGVPAPFDRTQHRHVIENSHCFICEVDVSSQSKHCSTCNKCVSNFDHHCKWLNNCVGRRNYRLFLATIAFALLSSVLIFSFCLTQFIAYFTDNHSGYILLPYQQFIASEDTSSTTVNLHSESNQSYIVVAAYSTTTQVSATSSFISPVFMIFYSPVPAVVWLVFTAVSMLIALAAGVMLTHLLSFHIFLISKNQTTYGYIVNQREKDEVNARNRDLQLNAQAFTTSSNLDLKSNKIFPVPDIGSQPLSDKEAGLDRHSASDIRWNPVSSSQQNLVTFGRLERQMAANQQKDKMLDVELKDSGLDCIQTREDVKSRTSKTICASETDLNLTNRSTSKHLPDIYDNQAAAADAAKV